MTHTPTPGWLAGRLAQCGHSLALSLLGAGLMYEATAPGSSQTFYEALSGSSDPLYELRAVYEQLGQRYDYLLDASRPLLGWAEQATPMTESRVRYAASELAKVDFEAYRWEMAYGDPLGETYAELLRMAERRREPTQFCDAETIATTMALYHRPIPAGATFIDTACATGLRPVLAAQRAWAEGTPPEQIIWRLADFDPMCLALTAINLVCADITGDVDLQVADFPANIRQLWPGVMEGADAGEPVHWITDVIETSVRVTGNGRVDPQTRQLPSALLRMVPELRMLYAAAHGAIEAADDEDIAEARAIVTEPGFVGELEQMVAATMGLGIIEHRDGVALVDGRATPREVTAVHGIVDAALNGDPTLRNQAKEAMRRHQMQS